MKIGKNLKEALSYIEKVNALARGDIVTVEGVPVLAREVADSFCMCEKCPTFDRCTTVIRDICSDVDAVTHKTHQILVWTNEEEEEKT